MIVLVLVFIAVHSWFSRGSAENEAQEPEEEEQNQHEAVVLSPQVQLTQGKNNDSNKNPGKNRKNRKSSSSNCSSLNAAGAVASSSSNKDSDSDTRSCSYAPSDSSDSDDDDEEKQEEPQYDDLLDEPKPNAESDDETTGDTKQFYATVYKIVKSLAHVEWHTSSNPLDERIQSSIRHTFQRIFADKMQSLHKTGVDHSLFDLNYAAPYLRSTSRDDLQTFEAQMLEFTNRIIQLHQETASRAWAHVNNTTARLRLDDDEEPEEQEPDEKEPQEEEEEREEQEDEEDFEQDPEETKQPAVQQQTDEQEQLQESEADKQDQDNDDESHQEAEQQPARELQPQQQRRKLRIGYVSGDLRSHVVNPFASVLTHCFDRSEFLIFVYLTCPKEYEDSETKAHERQVGRKRFRRICLMSTQQAVDCIRADRIDILVDLNGWTGFYRLDVFALRPAPIQVSWMGYCNSTGLTAETGMDYRLVDSFTDPVEENNGKDGETKDLALLPLENETLWRMPVGTGFLCRFEAAHDSRWWAYDGGDSSSSSSSSLHTRVKTPAANASGPANANAPGATVVTFGSFNNVCKMNQAVIRVWVEILQRVPHSRLYIKGLCRMWKREPKVSQSEAIKSLENQMLLQQQCRRIEAAFQQQGLKDTATRLVFQFHQKPSEHIESYKQVDLFLDTFPYSGTSTTCQALEHSVPVLTYCPAFGHSARVSGSILSRIPELADSLITYSLESYIDRAVWLASNLDELTRLRNLVTPGFFASPVCQPRLFICKLEAEYKKMWQIYLEREPKKYV